MSCCYMSNFTNSSKFDIDSIASKLPSYDELKSYVKEALIYSLKNKKEHYDGNIFSAQIWWDYLPEFGRPMTDIELYVCVMSNVRIHLLPETKTLNATNLFEEDKEEKTYFISWNGRRGELMKGFGDFKFHSFKNDSEFISWLRDVFQSPVCECVSDESVLEYGIRHTINGMLWYGREEYNLDNRIKTFKNHNQFKADLQNFLKAKGIDSNGGCAGPHIDTYSYSCDYGFNKPKLAIDMDREYRISLGREIDESIPTRYLGSEDRVGVYSLEGNQFWETAFAVLKGEEPKEITLFDFI